MAIMTFEGPASVAQCIEFLKTQKPIAPLTWSPELANAARDHANDIGPAGIAGHSGSKGSTMKGRIEKYQKFGGYLGENISFGEKKSGLAVILQLIIDDGVSSRGHRANVFCEKF